MTASALRRAVVPVLALAAAACGREFAGGGDLRAQRVVLEREVSGLRETVARLERGEAVLPLDDVAIAIDDTLVRDLITAQLPFDMDVDRFHLTLKEAEVHFRGSPVVRLRGALNVKERPNLEAAVAVSGALEGIEVDRASSTLRAKIAVDHIRIEKAAGIESILSGSTLDELARMIRLEIKDRLPPDPDPGQGAAEHRPSRRDARARPHRRGQDAPPGGGLAGAGGAGPAVDLRALPARRPREDGRRAAGRRRERRPASEARSAVTVRGPESTCGRSRDDRPRPPRLRLRAEGPRHPREAAVRDRSAREGARSPAGPGRRADGQRSAARGDAGDAGAGRGADDARARPDPAGGRGLRGPGDPRAQEPQGQEERDGQEDRHHRPVRPERRRSTAWPAG